MRRKRVPKKQITAVRLPADMRAALEYIADNSGGRWDITRCVMTALDEWVSKKLPPETMKKLGYVKPFLE